MVEAAGQLIHVFRHGVITSYSIHYTKLYENHAANICLGMEIDGIALHEMPEDGFRLSVGSGHPAHNHEIRIFLVALQVVCLAINHGKEWGDVLSYNFV